MLKGKISMAETQDRRRHARRSRARLMATAAGIPLLLTALPVLQAVAQQPPTLSPAPPMLSPAPPLPSPTQASPAPVSPAPSRSSAPAAPAAPASAPATSGAPAGGRGSDTRISGGSATTNLMDQAAYWQQQGQPERALQSLERLIAAEPRNADALATAVEMASVSNQTEAAQRYLAQLRRVAPDDARLQRSNELVRLLSEDSATLTSARGLAAAGRNSEAISRYRQLFRDGQIPSVLATEYFQVLAGSSEAGYREATQQLRQRAAAAPNDPRLALNYAQILTYREESRSEGADRLQELARRPGQREAARMAWRQALLWLGDDPETAARIEAYLATNPTDPQIDAKLRTIQAGGVTPGGAARLTAWSAVERRNNAEAERQFNAALAIDANDAEAIVGLAVLRKIQNRYADSRSLLARAIAASPERADEFTRALGDLSGVFPGGTGGGGGSGRIIQGPTVGAWRALERGDLDGADRLARQAQSARGSARLEAELILGQVALRRRDFVAAEARFRNALTLRPRQPDALTGLYSALVGQERIAEAETFQREAGLPPNPGAFAARAFAMRERATLADNPEQSIALLRQGLTLDPGNAWLSVDLARKLNSVGRHEEAREIQARLAQGSSADASTAAALLALDDERFGDVVALLERVPVRLRNADTNRLLTASRREFEVRQVELQVREGRPGAMEALLAGAGRRDPSFTVGPSVVRAFGRLNDPLRAGLAARAALAANPNTTAADRIQLASALLEANRLEDASALAAPLLADRNLPAETRRQLAAVMETGAVQQSDALNTRQAPEQAYQVLAPALASAPGNVPLNMALVRLYLATNRAPEARQLVEAVLARDPRNLTARLALVDVALAQDRPREADALVTETAFLYPAEMQVTLAEARVARSRADYARALRLVETVAARRLEHLRNSGQLAEAQLTAQALRPGQGAGGQPAPTPAQLHDPLTAQIAQELIRARDEAAVWVQQGAYIQNRTGDTGTSRLTNLTVPTEVSMPMYGGIGGRVTVGADVVTLNTGALSTQPLVSRLFAANALPNSNTFQRARESIDGVAFRASYSRNNMRFDIGTTPLGFHTTNIVGGAEVVPRINEQLRLRLSVERRAVTDSLLSYAGQRDSAINDRFGGVIRTGGRAQLEFAPVGRFGAYAGAGYNIYNGQNVASNSRVDAGVGAYYGVVREPNQQLTVGVDLRYFAFDRNLSGFSFGQGGYFSPQQQIIASLQAEYIARWGDWSLRTVGAVGYQNFRSRSSPLFPTNSAMQSQLLASVGNSGLPTSVPAQRSDGPTGSVFANLEYAATPNLRLGIAGRWERVGDYEDAVGLFYLRWRLDRPRQDLLPLHAGASAPTLNVNDPIQSSYGNGRPEWVQLPSGATRPTW